MATNAVRRDFYKVLNIHRTASHQEIKLAYRKKALDLHPDRHDGCQIKADEFKIATEAYQTLSNQQQRNAHDRYLNGEMYNTSTNGARKGKGPPPNYRKVYAPRPPPGFKTFDPKRHFDMHYGDGMENEAIERARKRAEAASGRMKSGYEYQSPLGKGFTYQGGASNPFAKGGNKWSKTRGNSSTGGERVEFAFEYEEGYYDIGNSTFRSAKRTIHAKESVKQRMQERRKHRRRNRGDPLKNSDQDGCVVM